MSYRRHDLQPRGPRPNRLAAFIAMLLVMAAGCGDESSGSSPVLPTATAMATVSPTSPPATATSTTAPSATPTAIPTTTSTTTPSITPSLPPTDTPSPVSTATPSPSSSPVVEQIARLGDATMLTFDAASLNLELSRAGTTLLRFPIDGLQLGRVDAIDDSQNYDPYPIAAGQPILRYPVGLRWLSPETAHIRSLDAGSFNAELRYPEGKTAILAGRLAGDGRFHLQLTPEGGNPPIAIFRLRPHVDAEEGFYGLGEYLDSVNHRGKVRAMQLEVDPSIESSNNEAHVPVPLLIGTRGWGIFVESLYPGAFDVASHAADRVEVYFGTGAASTSGLSFYLFSADHPLDVTRHYYDVTGYPVLPDRWALGPLIWRDENRDQAEVESDIETIRDLDLATSGIWIDRPYASGVNTFDFKPSQFPDAQAMIDKAHDFGLRLGVWHTPYLDRSDPATAGLLAEARAADYYPLRAGLLLNNWGTPIDFTKPEAFEWWQGLIQRYIDMGIEGFKLDYAEDVVPGISGARNIWRFHDGSDERTMHNRYTTLYHQAYAELLPETGGFLLCRAGKLGGQRYARIIWPGDLDANMAKHRETVREADGDTFVAVGGLPASVIAGLSLGPSGYPFYGSDTGGYRHSPPDKETFVRWFEQTALSSVMQVGTSSNDVPWEFNDRNGFDQESLDWYRIYARLHLRLFPYEWTYAQRIAIDGRPIQRPLGLAHPELGIHPDDTYLFGDSLLVAPVVERDARNRAVPFPAGSWVDWWSGEVLEGGQTITVDAPLGKLPLFVRAGAIVPLLRPTIDTISPTTEPDRVDSYATTPGILYARLSPGSGAFTVFDGTQLQASLADEALVLASTSGSEFRFGTMWEIFALAGTVAEIRLDGQPLLQAANLEALDALETGWSRSEEAGGTLRVKVPAGTHSVSVVTN